MSLLSRIFRRTPSLRTRVALAMLSVSPPSIAANPGDANNLAWSFNSVPHAFDYLAVGEQLVLTPACGLAGATPDWPTLPFDLLRAEATHLSG